MRTSAMHGLPIAARVGYRPRQASEHSPPINKEIGQMREVSIVGAGMVKFGKYLDTSMKVLARDAVNGALSSAGLE